MSNNQYNLRPRPSSSVTKKDNLNCEVSDRSPMVGSSNPSVLRCYSGPAIPASPSSSILSSYSGSGITKVPESPETLEDAFSRVSFKNPEQQPKSGPQVVSRTPETLEGFFNSLSLSTNGSETGSRTSSTSSSLSSSSRPRSQAFGQPFEKLFDQFDKDPSVGAMVRGQEFAKQHFMKQTYSGNSHRPELLPKRRESCDSSISSVNSSPHGSGSSEAGKYKHVVLDPFSKASPSPPAKKQEQGNEKWDKEFDNDDHWFF